MTKHGAETAERGRKIKQIEDYRGIAPDEVLHDISDFTVIHVP
jgi:hypothetical protein